MADDGKFHTLTFKDLTIDDTSQIKVEAMGKSCEAKLTVLGMCYLICIIVMNFLVTIVHSYSVHIFSLTHSVTITSPSASFVVCWLLCFHM